MIDPVSVQDLAWRLQAERMIKEQVRHFRRLLPGQQKGWRMESFNNVGAGADMIFPVSLSTILRDLGYPYKLIASEDQVHVPHQVIFTRMR